MSTTSTNEVLTEERLNELFKEVEEAFPIRDDVVFLYQKNEAIDRLIEEIEND